MVVLAATYHPMFYQPGRPSRPGGPVGPRAPGRPCGPGGPRSPFTTMGAGGTPGSPGGPRSQMSQRKIISLKGRKPKYTITLTERQNAIAHQSFHGLQGLQDDRGHQESPGLPSSLSKHKQKKCWQSACGKCTRSNYMWITE